MASPRFIPTHLEGKGMPFTEENPVSVITHQTGSEPYVFDLFGSVDFNSVPELRKKLIRAVKKIGRHRLELNFAEVTKMDTSGVAMLVELYGLAASKGGRLSLRGLNDQSRRMIRLARLDQVFVLADNHIAKEG